MKKLINKIDKSVKLTYAYCSKAVNSKVNDHPNSHHIYSCAADILCLANDQDRIMHILMNNPNVDLCQNYPDRNFVHVNIARPSEKPRRLARTQYRNTQAVPYTK